MNGLVGGRFPSILLLSCTIVLSYEIPIPTQELYDNNRLVRADENPLFTYGI